VPRITDFCSCIYVFGCKLSLVRLCDSDFGITPVDDITIWITCAAFYYYYYYYYYYITGHPAHHPGTALASEDHHVLVLPKICT